MFQWNISAIQNIESMQNESTLIYCRKRGQIKIKIRKITPTLMCVFGLVQPFDKKKGTTRAVATASARHKNAKV